MTNQEKEHLRRLLYYYWFDRPRDDPHIVAEMLRLEPRETVLEFVRLIRVFISSSEPLAEKVAFLHSTLRRYWDERSPDSPVRWLEGVADMMDQGVKET